MWQLICTGCGAVLERGVPKYLYQLTQSTIWTPCQSGQLQIVRAEPTGGRP